jgi:hypothetical protein
MFFFVQVISILDGVEGISGKSHSLRSILNLNSAVVKHILSKHLLPSYDVFTARKRHTSLQKLLTAR